MLKKKFRLASFRKLDKASFSNSHFFTLKFSKSQEKGPRFAFVVSKKIDKRAVARNKIKRYLSGSIEKIINNISSGDYILIAKKAILNKDQREVETEVKRIFAEKSLK